MDNQLLGYIISFVLGVLTLAGGLAVSRATARNYDAKTIETLSRQVEGFVKQREKDIEERENDRKEFKELQGKFAAMELEFTSYKNRIRAYFDQLMAYFDNKGLTDYPKPPIDRDTKDKMKPVKGKE